MKCANHPDVEAATRCDGCAEPFCQTCIVEVGGQKYCGACKVIATKNRKRAPRPIKKGTVCSEAYVALACAIGGLLCCCVGLALHPTAIALAHKSIVKIRASRDLTGIEVARAAQGISIAGLVMIAVQLLEIVVRIATDESEID